MSATVQIDGQAEMTPRTCYCGWRRPTTIDVSKDAEGEQPIDTLPSEFFFLYDCPCGCRWHARMERVS